MGGSPGIQERHDLPAPVGQVAVAHCHAVLEQEHRMRRHALGHDVGVGGEMLFRGGQAVERIPVRVRQRHIQGELARKAAGTGQESQGIVSRFRVGHGPSPLIRPGGDLVGAGHTGEHPRSAYRKPKVRKVMK